jgi:hypothetical protein
MLQRNQFASYLRTFAFGLFCLFSITLQAQTRVLAPGRPPLTSEMADKMAIFFEWALDVRFTPAQAQEYEGMLVNDWSDPAKRKSTLELLQMMDKVATVPPDTRDQVQAAIRRTLLDNLCHESQDAEARWMLALYDAAHPTGIKVEPAAAVSGSALDSRLTGKWRSSSVASIQYKNSYTGAMAPTSGSSFFYEFLPDGTYRNNGLMQVTTYGCTSSIYRDNSGRYRVEGDHLYIESSRGIVKSQVCGGQPSEKPDKLEVSAHVFRFESGANGEVLVIKGVDGKSRSDYFRREK